MIGRSMSEQHAAVRATRCGLQRLAGDYQPVQRPNRPAVWPLRSSIGAHGTIRAPSVPLILSVSIVCNPVFCSPKHRSHFHSRCKSADRAKFPTMPASLRIRLAFPDLFIGFLQTKPTLNPNYVQARKLSEERISRYGTAQTHGGTSSDI